MEKLLAKLQLLSQSLRGQFKSMYNNDNDSDSDNDNDNDNDSDSDTGV